MTEIWAHARSQENPVPNVMAAFAAAVTEGADGLELDVHLTADGQLVCAHDATLHDADGTEWVIGRLDYSTLSAYRNPRTPQSDAPLPLLQDVYHLLRQTDVRLNIEAKNLVPRYPGMATALIRSISASAMAERIVVSSFDHALLVDIRRQAPSISCAALFADGLIRPWDYLRGIGIDQAHPHFSALPDRATIDAFHDAGITIRAWTVNDPALWAAFSAAGVDAIITDMPVDARRVTMEAQLPAQRG